MKKLKMTEEKGVGVVGKREDEICRLRVVKEEMRRCLVVVVVRNLV